MKLFLRLCLVSLAVGLVALKGADSKGVGNDKAAATKGSLADSDYALQPGDTITVQALGEDKLNAQMQGLRISQEGKISLPFFPETNLKGLTVREAQERITKLYIGDYLVNPQIRVVVVDHKPRTVFVTGQVKNSGEIEIPPEGGLTLTQAISKAGGFTTSARMARIQLTRKLPDGTLQTKTINYDLVKNPKDVKSPPKDDNFDWPLQDGDIIDVPTIII